MPDFGLTEALAAALKASKSVPVMRPAEQALAARAAKAAPAAAAPVVPDVARTPSVQAPPAEVPPGSTQAPPINPSQPPAAVAAPPQPDLATVTPASEPVAASSAAAAPPTPAAPDVPVAPTAAHVSPSTVAPGNALPAPPGAPQAPPPLTPVQQTAQRFVTANMGDFEGKLNQTHMPNVNTMSTPDGVKAAILQIADDNKGAINEARRGTISDEQLTGLAQDLSINGDVVKQVMSREFGTSMQRPEVVLAARMLEQQQMGALLGLSGKVADGSATSAEIAQFEQTAQLVQQYRIQLSGAAAEQGRGLRAMQIPVGLPNDVMDHVANVLKQNNPDQAATAAAIRLAGTPGGIANIVSGMADMPLWRRTVAASSGLLQRIYINGILSGPSTWAKILIGNNVNLLANSVDIFAAGIGRKVFGHAARAGEFPSAAEGVQLSDAMAHVHGVISGTVDALRVAGRVMKSGQSLDLITRAGETGNAAGRNTTAAILPEIQDTWFGSVMKGIDTVIDVPGSRIISPLDELTKTMGYRGYVTMMQMKELRSRAAAGTLRPGDAESVMHDLMTNPSPELQQAAEDWAHRMTFQSPFPEGGPGEAFQTLINKAPALRFIFPFMRTATNIFKQSLTERTPLAIFSARVRGQIAAGGFEGDLAKSRIATGTAIGSMLAWMAIHDRITGDAPKDPRERAAWALDGRTPNSIRITDPINGKDTWRDYTWFEPMSTIASTVADIVKVQAHIAGYDDVDSMMDHDQRVQDAVSNVMAAIIQNTGNKTFMQGASQFSEMYTDPQHAFSMWANQMGASMVPYSGALKFARNEQDPFIRQAKTLIDKIKDELPTAGGVAGSKTLPAKLDIFGEPRVHKGGNAILGPLNPLPGSDVRGDDVTDEIQSVMDATRVVPIGMPSSRVAYLGAEKGLQGGAGMPLTPAEYNDYITKARHDPVFDGGKVTFHEKLQQAIETPVYQQATPAQRVEFLAQITRQADKLGLKALWDDNDDFRERMIAWKAEANQKKFNQ